MITFGMVGAGGMGREQIFLAPHSLSLAFPGSTEGDWRIVHVEDEPHAKQVNGIDIVSMDDFIAGANDDTRFNIGINNSKTREAIADKLAGLGIQPLQLTHPTAEVRPGNDIAEGAIFSFQTLITTGITIGRFFQCMSFAQIAHDSKVGDFCSFGSKVCCNGNIEIGNHVEVGTNVMIRNGQPGKPLKIGDGAVLGMGAVVTKDVPPGAVMVGNPARPLVK